MVKTRPKNGQKADLAEIAQWLDHLSATTNDPRYKHASSILRAPRAGRPPSPDDAAIIDVRLMVETGRARTIEAAAREVAIALPDAQSIKSTTRRLARKAR